MGEKLVVGPINRGIQTDRLPFNIDNDSFPNLLNAYHWRGRLKRKRGTSLLNRLQRFFNSTNTSYSSTSTISLVGGAANLLTGFSLQAAGNIVPGSVTINDVTASITYTDPSQNGTLTGGAGGTINYATGAITITGGGADSINAAFRYYPDLPVMGLEDLNLLNLQFTGTLGFDTTYSYNISTSAPYSIYDVSFYKNPPTDAVNLPGYVPKTNVTPTTWNGQSYQQFWTTNYEEALWTTNGINVPFNVTNIGMQFKPIVAVTVTAGGPPAIVNLQITGHGLVQGDFLFINEVVTTTGINFQTGYVTTVVNANNVTVEFPFATIATNGTGGIAQYLTNRANTTIDSLRWYDGDPTNGNATSPVLNGNNGWVNFAPPLSNLSYSVDNLPKKQYYLVGARIILPYKGRLLFIGPVIQSSAAGSQVYLQDTVIFSQFGTPYYTASYTNSPNAAVDTPASPTNVLHPVLVPSGQTAISAAYFEDLTGFGGFVSAGISQPIVTAGSNEDVLILGAATKQFRFVYSENDLNPYNFYFVNSELGSQSTFSSVIMDRSVITIGDRGIIQTSQISAERIDLQIPDQIFEFSLTNNGPERVCAQRDFINEWIYFTYLSNEQIYTFPNQTLQYNYREQTWSQFNETYTTYGTFRKQTGYTWATIGTIFPSWNAWNEPWNAGASTLLQPKVIAGNQQGFVFLRDEGTAESPSLTITSFTGSQINSPNHCLNTGDYIIISGCIGTISYQVNGKIFSIVAVDQNNFILNPPIGSGTYFGGGVITRLYVPQIQSKQFPPSWGLSRKTRLGPQQYLLTRSDTDQGQITLLIFLSMNEDFPYNIGTLIPPPPSSPPVLNSSLIYSTILFTCPEGTNLGLTPANINLNMVTGGQQDQIWHRVNTSLLGDTIQVGFTMSDTQMRALDTSGPGVIITAATQANPCVLTCANNFAANQVVNISSVVGMVQLNGNTYVILSANSTSITIGVDSTAFSAYISGGAATLVAPINQFAEIEIHGFILDVSPSQVLA